MKKTIFISLFVVLLSSGIQAQEGFIGEVKLFAGNFAPRGWAFCEGQLLSISSNPALFSILGTTYGGDGRTTFGLPDLRSRVPMSPGRAPGLNPVVLGQKFQLFGHGTMTSHKPDPPQGSTKHGALGIHYIICVEGIFPSRN